MVLIWYAGPYVTGALFELRGGRQTAMFVLGAINFALGTLILFFRPAQQCAHAVQAHCMLKSHSEVGSNVKKLQTVPGCSSTAPARLWSWRVRDICSHSTGMQH